MQTSSITQYAHALYRAHGDMAEVEAARKAHEADTDGQADEARKWQSIRMQIKELRGAHQG